MRVFTVDICGEIPPSLVLPSYSYIRVLVWYQKFLNPFTHIKPANHQKTEQDGGGRRRERKKRDKEVLKSENHLAANPLLNFYPYCMCSKVEITRFFGVSVQGRNLYPTVPESSNLAGIYRRLGIFRVENKIKSMIKVLNDSITTNIYTFFPWFFHFHLLPPLPSRGEEGKETERK